MTDLLEVPLELDDDGSSSNGHQPPARPIVLPRAFWSARPELEHLRQAAFARLVSPDAVLGCALARVIALTHHSWALPPIVAGHAGLELFVIVRAPAGAGKGGAMSTAAELIPYVEMGWPIAGRFVDSAPLGSGEGLVKLFFEEVDETVGKGRTHKVQKQTCWNALLRVDEVDDLTRQGARRDQTVTETLRRAWSREAIGGSYSDRDRDRRLAGGRYRLSLVMGVQPGHGGWLLDATSGGTPQRFAWLSGVYPEIPDEPAPWPGPLDWRPPRPTNAGVQLLAVEDTIAGDLRAEHLARVRGHDTDPHNAHAGLRRLKVATSLAILAGRTSVGLEDWTLAGIIAATSDAVRDLEVAHTLQTRRDIVKAEAARAGARRMAELEVEEDRTARRAVQCAEILARRVRAKGTQTAQDLRNAAGSRYRDVLPDARAVAIERGWLLETDDGWAAGPKATEVGS